MNRHADSSIPQRHWFCEGLMVPVYPQKRNILQGYNNKIFVSDRSENTVEKGENADYHHFLHFSNCIQKAVCLLSFNPLPDDKL